MKFSELKSGDYFYVRNLQKPGSYPNRFLRLNSKNNSVFIEGSGYSRGDIVVFKNNQQVYTMVAG